MPRLRIGTPLWVDQDDGDDRGLRFPPLGRRQSVDVVIVGGGFTGATTAWRFADAGVRVAVVEAARIGRGSTAASSALLMQEPDLDFGDLIQRYGRGRAQRLWRLSQDATRECVAAIGRLEIACELSPRESVYYALTAPGAERLLREQRLRKSAGLGSTWLSPARLRRQVGIVGAGAIRVGGNAQINPLQACRGFMRAAVDRGAAVFEHSPVTRIRPARDHVTVSTASGGSLVADAVIVATGYATARFRPLTGHFRLLDTYAAATRPMTARERRGVGLDEVMVWDTNRPYHYARWTNDGRLLFGGGDRPHSVARLREETLRAGIDDLRAYFVDRFPSLEHVPLAYAWGGLFAMTPDSLPYIGTHRRYPRHLFALGYGGNGMTFGFLAGRLLLEWYLRGDAADLDLFAFSRTRR